MRYATIRALRLIILGATLGDLPWLFGGFVLGITEEYTLPPRNASISADGFRFYSWMCLDHDPNSGPGSDQCMKCYRYDPDPEVKVLSVTSIKKLCGESFILVNWQLTNLINAAMGTTQRITYGPRGGKHKSYVKDGEFPGQFVQRLLATEGTQAGLDKTRAWLREAGEKPRDTAAVRGTIVHEAIELGAKLDQIDRAYVEAAVPRLSASDQRKMKSGVQDEDVDFVRRAVANYWDMRVNVPFVILAREVQVWNLTAGYGGQADALVWFLGKFNPNNGEFIPLDLTPNQIAEIVKLAKAGLVNQEFIERIGGHVALVDWKTGSGPFTDQVVQVTAYLGAEFIGSDGVIDQRLTDIIRATNKAGIVFVRPEGWEVDFLDYSDAVMYAFLGSVAYARFLAANKEPTELLTHTVKGRVE